MNTEVKFITRNGQEVATRMPFGELINIKIGSVISYKLGFGFQPLKFYEKVSDYTFVEVSLPY